jgi:nucleotide-binding universal stress UspA family protein
MLRSILVPLDGSALAERALPIALDIARRAGGEVHLVRAHVPLAIVGATAEGVFTQDMLAADDALRDRAKRYVEQKAQDVAKEWGVKVSARVEDGTPGACITQAADDVNAGLIVMTTHGAGGFAPGWLGSVCDAVIRHSHRAVLALPENDAHAGSAFVPKQIAMALDGSSRADGIIPIARDLALLFGASVEVVRMVAPFIPNDVASILTSSDRPDPYGIDAETLAAKDAIDNVVKGLSDAGVKARATVRVELSPVKALLAHVEETDPDLLALATQGRGVSRLFVGSVADKLIRGAKRPVLVLRPMKD